jgi:hypothetical protein
VADGSQPTSKTLHEAKVVRKTEMVSLHTAGSEVSLGRTQTTFRHSHRSKSHQEPIASLHSVSLVRGGIFGNKVTHTLSRIYDARASISTQIHEWDVRTHRKLKSPT